jgi:hypothetical protein
MWRVEAVGGHGRPWYRSSLGTTTQIRADIAWSRCRQTCRCRGAHLLRSAAIRPGEWPRRRRGLSPPAPAAAARVCGGGWHCRGPPPQHQQPVRPDAPQVGRMVLCDRCGTRMPAVRATIDAKIGKVYKGLDLTLECFPADDVPDDPDAFKKVRAYWPGGGAGGTAPAGDHRGACRPPRMGLFPLPAAVGRHAFPSPACWTPLPRPSPPCPPGTRPSSSPPTTPITASLRRASRPGCTCSWPSRSSGRWSTIVRWRRPPRSAA